MALPVVYDVTRLATRVLNKTPNGIDRIDSAFAQYFTSTADADRPGMLLTPLGPRVVSPRAARDIVHGIARHWGEKETPDDDGTFERIVAWIDNQAAEFKKAARIRRGRNGRLRNVLRWVARHGPPIGQAPQAAMPQQAIYLNVSQFPLWVAGYFRWTARRPDIKPVFFIHDLLPIEAPEYFRKGEPSRHRLRLANLAQFGAAAIVTTHVVREALERHLHGLGRKGLPILVAPIPAAPIFSHRESANRAGATHPYFVCCGTIEPRKNHLLLLHIWRELVRRDGAAAPKLILVGTRGWENENIVDLLERCQAISHHVLEVSGLSTPALKRLLDGARALLMPSFAEGYGLPVAEALAAGVPVIASDLPVFREIGGEAIIPISPIDGEKWLETIRGLARADASGSWHHAAEAAPPNRPDWPGYFAKVEDFLAGL